MANLTGDRSNFPTQIDEIMELYTLPASQKTNALRYQTLLTKTPLTTLEQEELNQLTSILQSYIIDVEKWNKFGDIIVNMQNHYINETVGFIDNLQLETTNYVNLKKGEMNSYVDTKQLEINNYVDLSKTDMANYSDNTKASFETKVNQFEYKGDYVPSSQYYKFNVVSLEGNIYLAKDDTTGNPPTNQIYWSLMARKGDKGEAGIGLTFRGAYDNNWAYNIDDAVSLDGVIYYCIKATLGNIPPNLTYWAIFIDTNALSDVIGDLSLLNTENKSNLVYAINETKITASSIQPTSGWWFKELS